jgi:hypothetical protein
MPSPSKNFFERHGIIEIIYLGNADYVEVICWLERIFSDLWKIEYIIEGVLVDLTNPIYAPIE